MADIADITNAAVAGQGVASKSLAPVTQGINNGNDYALTKASLDIQQQHATAQLGQMQELKRMNDIHVGELKFNDLSQASLMENGEHKTAWIKARDEYWDQTGSPMKPTWWAMTKDNAYRDAMSSVAQGFLDQKAVDPKTWGDNIAQVASMTANQEFVPDFLSKAQQGINMMKTAGIRADATVQAAGINAEAKKATVSTGLMKSSQGAYEKATQPIRMVMEGGLRARSMLQEGMKPDGSIVITPQVIHFMGSEEERLNAQKNNTSEGGVAAATQASWAQGLKGILQQAKDAPEGVLSPANAKQMMAVFDHQLDQYAAQHDTVATSLAAGSTDVQKQVIGQKAKAFQSQYSKRIGRWAGDGVDMGDGGPKIKPDDVAAAPAEKPAAEPKSTAPKPVPAAVGAQLKDRLKKAQDSGDADTVQKIQDTLNGLSPEARKKMGF